MNTPPPDRCANCHTYTDLGIVRGAGGYYLGWTCQCYVWERATPDLPTHATALERLRSRRGLSAPARHSASRFAPRAVV